MKNIQLLLLSLFALPLISKAQTVAKDTSIILCLQEDKAYLSFDKPYYTAGETMYFKAFLANAISHKPDTLTTVLYVDFTDLATNRVILQQRLKVERGKASGSFYTEGVNGTVFVHAYTSWMGNVGADFHFNKNIEIFEPKNAAALTIVPKEPKKKIIAPATKLDVPEVNNESIKNAKITVPDTRKIQFFPESGNLLEGFANKIAFKATDETGQGAAVKGVVKNNNGDEVAKIEDHFIGMGRFTLVVKKGETYTAFVEKQDGTFSTFPLPKAQKNSATMTVENLKDTADIKVVFYFNYDSLAAPNVFNVIAHQRGKVCFNNSIAVKKKQALRIFKMTIPRAAFEGEGIGTITLTDESGKPIAERLVFLHNKQQSLNINLTTEKTVFNKRERVTVNIETKTMGGQPIAADLSFAVTNSDKITPPQYAEDLRAYMLLRSDLRGHIEQPSFYFEDTTFRARLALDNLLMTQGWRRFNWNEKPDSLRFKFEQGLSVKALLRKKKAPAVDVQLMIFMTRNDNNRTESAVTQTSNKGEVILEDLDFTDSAQLYFNIANSTKNYTVEQEPTRRIPSVSDPNIYLAEQPSGNVSTYQDAAQAFLLNQKLRMEREILLEEFEVKARKRGAFDKDPRISSSYTDRSFVVDDDDQGSLTSFLEGKFIKVSRTDYGDIVLRHSRGSNAAKYNLVVDGFGQTDGFILNNLTMNDIQRVDIINSGNGGYMVSSIGAAARGGGASNNLSFGGASAMGDAFDGVVHILTKAGDPNYLKKYGRSMNTDIPMLSLAGYTRQKQFYTPDYAVQKPEYAEPDRRTTLFWSPTISTDATGKTSVSFYTTDDTQTAKILVEGIDETGKVGVAKGNFRVKE